MLKQAEDSGRAPLGRLIGPPGARLHVLEGGADAGLPLVLLHGASGNLRDWALSVFEPLAGRRRVIAFDRPGFGHSDPVPGRGWRLEVQGARLRAGLQALGVERYVLVGHSWSGALVLDWALRWPEEVAGLGIIAGATMDWGGGLGARYRLLSHPVLGAPASAIARRLVTRGMIRSALAEIFEPQPVPPRYEVEGGVDMALRSGTFRLNAQALDCLHPQIVENLPEYGRIDCPVEIIHGTADRLVPAAIHAEPLSRILPHNRLTLLDGVGHMPHHADPETLVARLLTLGPTQSP